MTSSHLNYFEHAVQQKRSGFVVWFTGLSGSGKTTLATLLKGYLIRQSRLVSLIDGDALRSGACRDLGYTVADRKENIRRAGEIARTQVDAGFIVLVALISPFQKEREQVRNSLPKGQFIEVFVNAPLEICEKRDVKGLYQSARRGLVPEFTGISSPYEQPLAPELELHTDRNSIEECLNQLYACLAPRLV
jgi:adenylylsulfate kinase